MPETPPTDAHVALRLKDPDLSLPYIDELIEAYRADRGVLDRTHPDVALDLLPRLLQRIIRTDDARRDAEERGARFAALATEHATDLAQARATYNELSEKTGAQILKNLRERNEAIAERDEARRAHRAILDRVLKVADDADHRSRSNSADHPDPHDTPPENDTGVTP